MPYGLITYSAAGSHQLNGQALSKNFQVMYRGTITVAGSSGYFLFPTQVTAANVTVVARRLNNDGVHMAGHFDWYTRPLPDFRLIISFVGSGTYEFLVLGDLSNPADSSIYIPPGGFGVKVYSENGGLNFSSDIVPFNIDLVSTFYNTNAATNVVAKPVTPAGMQRYYWIESGVGSATNHLNTGQIAHGLKRITETATQIFCTIPVGNLRTKPAGVNPSFTLISGYSPII